MGTINLSAIPKEHYFNNQLLQVEDFQRESSYHTLHRELQTRLLYNPGVLLGLVVSDAGSGSIGLSQGVAIDPNGAQILLVDQASYNSGTITTAGNSFSISLSDASFFSKSWELIISYNETAASTSSTWTVAPELQLLDATSGAPTLTSSQIALATIKVENTGTTQQPVVQLTITTPNRKSASIQSNKLPEIPAANINGSLKINQIPPLPPTQITGTFDITQIPDLPGSKINGTLDASQIPDLPGSKITGTLNATQIPDISASKISDKLATTQLPDIPASMITGKLSPNQLPPINVSAGTSIHVDTPTINQLGNVTVVSTVPDQATFTLTYMSGGTVITKNSTTDASDFTVNGNSYSISIPITQSTAVTLTATLSGGSVQQASSYIELVLSPQDYMTQLFKSGTLPNIAVQKVISQFGLQALSNNNVYTLTVSMYNAGYSVGDIYKYIAAYFNNLGFNYLSEYLTYQVALIKNLKGS